MLNCVEDSNPYQLSCPSSSVDGALASIVECRGFESNLMQVFFFPWRKVAVLGVYRVDLFVGPLLFNLVVRVRKLCASILVANNLRLHTQ